MDDSNVSIPFRVYISLYPNFRFRISHFRAVYEFQYPFGFTYPYATSVFFHLLAILYHTFTQFVKYFFIYSSKRGLVKQSAKPLLIYSGKTSIFSTPCNAASINSSTFMCDSVFSRYSLFGFTTGCFGVNTVQQSSYGRIDVSYVPI